ncbi:hypothetical protein DXD23_14950, partial [Ruminococcus sp. TF12-2]
AVTIIFFICVLTRGTLYHAVTLERTDTMFLSSLLGISEKSAKKGPLPKAVLTKLITQQPLENH